MAKYNFKSFYLILGMDLALEISKKAKRVILSHHLKETILTKFPDNVVQVGIFYYKLESLHFFIF